MGQVGTSTAVYQTADKWRLGTRLFTISNRLWENHDLTLQPLIAYIYFCERISVFCLSYFSDRLSVMDQKLT